MTDLPDLTNLTIKGVEPPVPKPVSYRARIQREYRKRKRAKIRNAMVAICTARNRDGRPCRKVGIGNPPLCSWHGGRVVRGSSLSDRLYASLVGDQWTSHIEATEHEREEQARIERIAALPQGEAYLTRQQRRGAEAAAQGERDATSRAAVQKTLDANVHQLKDAVAQSRKQLADYQALYASATASAEAYRTETHLWEIGAHPDQLRERFG